MVHATEVRERTLMKQGRAPGTSRAADNDCDAWRKSMSYIMGFVVPVPTANKDKYREMAAKARPICKE